MLQRLTETIGSFAKNDVGATAIEYGLIAGLIFLAIVTSVNGFADNMGILYNEINAAVENAIS